MPDILDQLNRAGEALKATGETAIVMSYFAASETFTEDKFGVRIELKGCPGVHGSGNTAAEAFTNALRQRDEDAERNEIERQIRDEIEARLATMQPRKAA